VTTQAENASAAGVRWDLSALFADAAAVRAALADAVARAARLEEHAARLDDLDAAGVRDLLDETSVLSGLQEVLSEAWGYAALRVLADSSDTEARDLVAESEAPLATVRDALRAVELAVGVRPLKPDAPELASYRHWIEHQQGLAAHRLTADAEQAFALRTPSASTAWAKLSQETLTAAAVPFDAGEGEQPHSVVELRLLRYHADRDVRLRAREALLAVYDEKLPIAAACLDAVVADRLAEDRLRGRSDPMAATLTVDEVPTSTVEHMLTTIEGRVDILARWLDRKRDALGLDALAPHDLFAPVGAPPTVVWSDAVGTTVSLFDALSPTLADTARSIFDAGWVDAERRPRKDGAVFCAPYPDGTYVFLSYKDSAKGATELAHEMGHATHFELAKRTRPWLTTIQPATAAFFEVPSTFAELAAAEQLSASVGGDEGKALLRVALDAVHSLVFWAAVVTRFEQALCARRASGQALTPERVDELWLEIERPVYGAVARRLGVMDIPHVFMARFYGYQYAYATLAALGLRAIRRADPDRFARDYVAMLEATGTGTPAELLSICGLDVDDPDVWRSSLDELDRLCDAAW
jgi:oligoendopeptidase F